MFCGLHARWHRGLLWHTNGSCWSVLRQWSQHLKTKVRLRPQKQHCAPICIWYESFLLVPCMFFAWDRVARHNLLLSFLDILIWFLCVCVFSCVFHLISFYVKKCRVGAEFQQNSDYPKQATPRHKLFRKVYVFLPNSNYAPFGTLGSRLGKKIESACR